MAKYDADARYRHLQLVRLLAKSADVPPRLDDPALQAELDALDALEQAAHQRQTGEELPSRVAARIEARRVDAVRKAGGHSVRGDVKSVPASPLKLVHSAPSQPPGDRQRPAAVEPSAPPAQPEK